MKYRNGMRAWKACLVLMILAVIGCCPEIRAADTGDLFAAPSEMIQIRRDACGVPHIVASSSAGAYYGFGYVMARDRLFQLELLRRSVEGTLAEILGPAFLEIDFQARRDGISDEELTTGLERSGAFFRQTLSAFTAGVNRAVAEVQRRGSVGDPAFAALGIKPEPFSELQILGIFAGTMAVRYNDFTQELDNQHLLNSLVKRFGAREASKIFEDVVPYIDRGVYSTLGTGGSLPATLRLPPHLPQDNPDADRPMESPTLRHRKRGELLKTLGIPEKSGSYAAVLSNFGYGKREAFLLGGPQMGYFKPSALYEIGLHTPDYDIVGTTPVGYFVILFGANRQLGFTATAGVSNLVDLIGFHTDKANPGLLIGERGEVAVASRTEVFVVKDSRRPVSRVVEKTALGPVIAHEGTIAYIKNRGWQGRVIDSYVGWFQSNHAKTLEEWMAQADAMALSINWLGADRNGHIAYVSCGVGKTRQAFGDDRLPTRRPTTFVYPDRRLAGFDPVSGYFANWNCPPVKGFRDGDLQTGWGRDQRTAFLAALLEAGRGSWSIDFLKGVDRILAFTDLRAVFGKGALLGAIRVESLTPTARQAFDAMSSWDNQRVDADGDGRFDHPGAGCFDQFWKEVFGELFGKTLGDFVWMIGSDPTWTQSALLLDVLAGHAGYDYTHGRPVSEIVTGALQRAVDQLASPGAALPLLPVTPMEFAGVNHVGAPTRVAPATFTPFMNRGSDIMVSRFAPEGIELYGVMPPGNTALGKNERDQVEDFRTFKYRRRPLLMREVTEATRDISYLRP